MKIVVNQSLCDGNGVCVREAPQLFHLDDDYQLHVLVDTIDAVQIDRARRAVQLCPKSALTLVDRRG